MSEKLHQEAIPARPIQKSTRSKAWGWLRRAFDATGRHPRWLWRWVWDREFESLISDRDRQEVQP